MSLLEVKGLNAYYGDSHILFDVALRVERNEVVALLGRNGAGKSTTLKSLMTRIVGPRVRATCRADGLSRWVISTKLIPAGLETDRCAAAKADLSDAGSTPSL